MDFDNIRTATGLYLNHRPVENVPYGETAIESPHSLDLMDQNGNVVYDDTGTMNGTRISADH